MGSDPVHKLGLGVNKTIELNPTKTIISRFYSPSQILHNKEGG